MTPSRLTLAERVQADDAVTLPCPACSHPLTVRNDSSKLPRACAKCGRAYTTEFYLRIAAHVRITDRPILENAP